MAETASIMRRQSWMLVVTGLAASAAAVQFDDPYLEIGGTTGFVLLFAWLLVKLRSRASALR